MLFESRKGETQMKKVLLIVGSMRKESFNRQSAVMVRELLQDKAEVAFLEYADIPFMNQDIERAKIELNDIINKM